MKTLVTGANGLMGSNIVRELINRGHKVRAFVRDGADIRTLRGLDIELYYGNLLNEKAIESACRGCDYVIHAAGKTACNQTSFSDYAEANVKGTQNVVRAIEKAGIKRMVHVSSCCAFGGGSIENPGTELSEFAGFKFHSGYINSKYLSQQWVLSEVEKKRLPIVVVNPTLMLGSYDSRPGSGEAILFILKQNLQFCPSGGKNFIDARDAAIGACNALTMGVPGECYLLAAENLTFTEFYNKVNKINNSLAVPLRIPGVLLKTAGLIGNVISSLTNHELAMNLVNMRQLANESYFSAKKAVRVLNLPQRPVDNAIRDAIDYFVENGFIRLATKQGFVFPAAA